MKPLDVLIARLRRVDWRRGENHIIEFERILAEINAMNTSEAIAPLLSFFDDSAPFDEPMFSLIHSIEKFSDQVYLEYLLQGVKKLYQVAPRWTSILFMRVLNSDTSRRELIRQVRKADQETKQVIRQLMEKINERSSRFLEKTTAVIVAAS